MEKITKFLNNWLKENDFDCTVSHGQDFAYNPSKNNIEYSLIVPENSEIIYQKVIHKLGLKYTCDSFITAFFHELGHYETEDDFEEETWTDYINMVFENSLSEPSEERILKYFYHPIELSATKWAIEYINSHANKVKKFWDTLQPLILEKYVNNIQTKGVFLDELPIF